MLIEIFVIYLKLNYFNIILKKLIIKINLKVISYKIIIILNFNLIYFKAMKQFIIF